MPWGKIPQWKYTPTSSRRVGPLPLPPVEEVIVNSATSSQVISEVKRVPQTPEKAISTGGAIWWYGDTDVGLDMDMVEDLGAEYVRLTVYWDQVETADNTYDWTRADRTFDAADARGIRVLWVIWGTPGWSNGSAAANVYPTNASAFGDFCAVLAARYANRGSNGGALGYELWNEPNFNVFSVDVGSTGRTKLAQMLNDAVPKIRNADPDAIVLGPGILRGGASGNSTYELDTVYVAGLYSAGLYKGMLDGFAFHPYQYPTDPADTAQQPWLGWSRIDDMRSALVSAGDNIPLWLTEWGQHTGTHTDAVSEANQALYLQNAWDLYETHLGNGDVAGPFFVYNHKNDGTDASNKEQNFGLALNDRTTHKQAWDVFVALGVSAIEDILYTFATSTQTALHADSEAVSNTATSTQIIVEEIIFVEAVVNTATSTQEAVSADVDIIHNRGPPSPESTQTLVEEAQSIDVVANSAESTQSIEDSVAIIEIIYAPGPSTIYESVMETL
jgi:hypothetical protein